MDAYFFKLILNDIFFISAAIKAHTASLIVSPGNTAEFDVCFHSHKVGRVTGIIHLSVIDNQYEETLIHLVGEGYKDDITLDNIRGLVASTNEEASNISEIIEVTEEDTMDNLLAGGESGRLLGHFK